MVVFHFLSFLISQVQKKYNIMDGLDTLAYLNSICQKAFHIDYAEAVLNFDCKRKLIGILNRAIKSKKNMGNDRQECLSSSSQEVA